MTLRCQCPFSGPSDTILGCHRDPITCEKGWLDFAVRELSRVAAGKARGQEAVWRSQCKPDWWDCECRHPWKNPTANPKDSKDTLKEKFECLVQHLRKEGQLPREMEHEVDLWEKDRKSEVFMMTSLSSLLGQASNLHFLVNDTCPKIEKSGIPVDISILADLQNCLTACVNKLGSIRNMADKRNHEDNTRAAEKRAGKRCLSSETDPVVPQPPCKHPKPSVLSSPPLSSTISAHSLVLSPASALSSSPSPSLSPPPAVTNVPISADLQMKLLAALRERNLQKQVSNVAGAASSVCQTTKTHRLPKSKAHLVHPCRDKGEEKKGVVRAEECSITAAVDISVRIPLSASQLAAVPQNSFSDMANSTDFADLLDFDLEGSDLPFLNNCPVKATWDTSVNNTTTADSPCLVSQSIPNPSIAFTEPGALHNSHVNHCNHDPFVGHSPSSGLSESSPFQFDVECETAAGRQVESIWAAGETGTASASDVGDMITSPQDTEVSDAGYQSESSVATFHRDSLDSEFNEGCPDLSSPDLEAFLNSLLDSE